MKLKDYEAVYIEYSENTVYICRRASERGLFRIIESADKERIEKYIKYFSTHKFSGFCGDFCLNGKYYVVFDNPDGVPLKSAAEIPDAKKIVKALAIQNPPPEIAVKIMSREYIFVCGEEIEFAYDLPETDMISRELFWERLADLVDSFWQKPINERAEKWLSDLREGKFENIPAAYKHMPDQTAADDFSDEDRFEKIKSVLAKIAAVIASVIIAALAVSAATDGEDAEYGNMEYIGTIDLRKN